MDALTSSVYESHAAEKAALYGVRPSAAVELIQRFLPGAAVGPEKPKTRILDIGAGSGRDIAALIEGGYDSYGIEPAAAMRAQAAARFSLGPERLAEGCLPELDLAKAPFLKEGGFAAILLSAVVQHIQENELFDSLFSLHRLVAEGGTIIIVHPCSYAGLSPGPDGLPRDPDGRLFCLRPGSAYDFHLSRLGYRLIDSAKHSDGFSRPGISWESLVFRKEAGGQELRPLEKIESIIRNDVKTTSYKFALLRALAEIAMTSYRNAVWLPDDRVGIDIKLIVEKWLEYYWPLVADARGILQGPKQENRQDIIFRNQLKTLIDEWGGAMGRSPFFSALRSGSMSGEKLKTAALVFEKIRSAIINGPVVYSGKSNARLGGPLFSMKGSLLCMGSKLWKEFCLLGPWIRDSLILNWAGYTAELPKQSPGIEKGGMINLLDQELFPERSTVLASDMYRPYLSQGLGCVWTGMKIKSLEIDHALPYALWHNNDLWNLLPSDESVNGKKLAKLPTR